MKYNTKEADKENGLSTDALGNGFIDESMYWSYCDLLNFDKGPTRDLSSINVEGRTLNPKPRKIEKEMKLSVVPDVRFKQHCWQLLFDLFIVKWCF